MKRLIDDMTYRPDGKALLERVKLDPDSDEADDFRELLNRIAARARPKAFVASATVSIAKDSAVPGIWLDDVEFGGGILHENLKDLEVVWPYVATCGLEAYNAVMSIADPFERIWGEIILEDVLAAAERGLNAFVKKEAYSGKTAAIAPGSLIEWPIEQQAPLFRLLGDGPEKCGITLTSAMLMLPNKSISGIVFPNEHGYVSCALCPRDNCPNRRAPRETTFHR